MKRFALRPFALLATLAVASGIASGYYHFVHYDTKTAPFLPIYEKFDLASLPGKTIQYYISANGPTKLAPRDSLTSVISQVRAAAMAWNVEASDLSLAFGGISPEGAARNGPGIDVIFSDEIPPGLIALGGPTKRADDMAEDADGRSFVPIVRSLLVFNRDLSQRPSYGDAFYLSAVHEFGHTLGLQHTLTSSAMSTEITRAVSKAWPLAADDVAAISLLYPHPQFQSATGAIAGRVVLAGDGVGLASVVALPPRGQAVSTLTNPDGTYRIEGLPPGDYYLYAHPLPPALAAEVSAANIVLPKGPDQEPLQAGPNFETQFFPGTREWQQAGLVSVAAGAVTEGLNFSVQPRSVPFIHSVQTYSYPGQYGVKGAFVNFASPRGFIVAAGAGILSGPASAARPAEGLTASVIGDGVSVTGLRPFTSEFMVIDLQQSGPQLLDGPRHIVFSLDGSIYVLPSAFTVVQKGPPSIDAISVAPGGLQNRTLALSGANLSSGTRYWFDGQPATLVQTAESNAVVVAPPAPAGHVAVVTALNSDGQTSMFTQFNAPPTYSYDVSLEGISTVTITPDRLPVGADSVIEISAPGAMFTEGQALAGFGSSDITVQRVVALSPSRVAAAVRVGANAAAGTSANLTIASGLKWFVQPAAVTLRQPDPERLAFASPDQSMTASETQSALQPNSNATLRILNLTQAGIAAGLSLTLGDKSAPILAASPGQITVRIPNLAAGPVLARLTAGGEIALALLDIDAPPPSILSVFGTFSVPDATRPASVGDLLTVLITGIPDLGTQIASARASVTVGTTSHQVSDLVRIWQEPVAYQMQFRLGSVPAGRQNLIVMIDGRTSASFPIWTR
ncbi:MAG: matrixin family metalloprotease [Bryobacteraceae bacterium]|nr:matrixin family metalloprotease [Bryobacterales bacterium]MEB2361461.1 matrixin family metalloprotease [Bryobacterales bacterium]NUN02511.1 matrixin family metalloprotease [Bryobacteraceae bacterium]